MSEAFSAASAASTSDSSGPVTVWFCEQDEFCRRVLARHWPGVPCFPDVRALVADADSERQLQPQGLESDERRWSGDCGDEPDCVPVSVPHVDVLCGGFPCQDLSLAGKGAGITGARSGLWSEYARLVGELRPRYVVVENVPALLGRGVGRVLGDLAALGYDAEWDCLPASAFGAPHRRDRIWIVAYPQRGGDRAQVFGGEAGRPYSAGSAGGFGGSGGGSREGHVADAGGERFGEGPVGGIGRPTSVGSEAGNLAGVSGEACRAASDERRPLDNSLRGRHGPPTEEVRAGRDGAERPGWWLAEPDVGRVAHGVPARVDRLRALGNSLVPQIAEWIGRRIMSFEQEREAA